MKATDKSIHKLQKTLGVLGDFIANSSVFIGRITGEGLKIICAENGGELPLAREQLLSLPSEPGNFNYKDSELNIPDFQEHQGHSYSLQGWSLGLSGQSGQMLGLFAVYRKPQPLNRKQQGLCREFRDKIRLQLTEGMGFEESGFKDPGDPPSDSLKFKNYLMQSTLDSLDRSVVILNKKGNIVYTNRTRKQNCMNFNNLTRDDNYLEKYREFLKKRSGATDRQRQVLEGIEQVLNKQREEFAMVYDCETEQGLSWFRIRVTPFVGIGPFEVIITQEDVTEEIMLKHKYRVVLENTPGIILQHNHRQELVFIEGAVKDILGVPPESLREKPGDVLEEKAVEEWRYYLDQAFIQKQEIEFQTTLTRDGETRYYNNIIVPRLSGDRVESAISLSYDITERKKMEDRYRRQKTLYQQLFDNSPEAILLLDQQGQILRANYGFQELFGYEITEVVGQAPDRLIVPEELKQEGEIFSEMVYSGEEVNARTLRQRRNGEQFHVKITAFPVILEQNYLGVYVIYRDISDEVRVKKELEKKKEELKKQNHIKESMIMSLMELLDLHDTYTRGHSEKVAHLSRAMAEKLGLSEAEIETSYWAGLIHDIGKVLIPEKILKKEGTLSQEEYDLVKKHPLWGCRTLNKSDKLDKIPSIVLHHHEHWNGQGYPHGLSGESIPLISRIIHLVDAWVALRSDRAYRKSIPPDQALQILQEEAGVKFDPDLVEKFINLINQENAPI